MRSAPFVLATLAFLYGSGCDGSPSSSSSSPGGGGSGGTASAGGGAGGTVSGGGGGGGSGGSAGSTSTGTGGALCPDPANPMFGSCVESFLQGCYEPDLAGTCTDEGGNVTWSDGSKYVTNGPMPGLYGPGDAQPCIAVVITQSTITATKGSETLVFEADQATQTATISCPDGSQLTATLDQVTAFNRCTGVNCP